MSYLRKKKTTTTETNAKAKVGNEAKFVSVLLKNKVELSSSVEININFLGSCHAASKHPGAGTQYGGYRHIYYNFSLNGDVCVVNFTFSGPTKLDVKKPTIKSITEEATAVLKDLVHNVNLLKKTMVINIQGHSRGGVVADTIHKRISSPQWRTAVRVGKLSIADPYAGPLNRLVHKNMNNFNKNMDNFNKNSASDTPSIDIPTDNIAVYTVAEKRFRTPANSLKKSRIVVFTDVTHDKTKYIAEYVFKHSNETPFSQTNQKIYICADSEKNLKSLVSGDPKKVEEWMKKNITPVDEKNIDDILQGKRPYEHFAYKNISSDGRRELFYAGVGMVDKTKVLDFLEKNKHTSMHKKTGVFLR